VLLFGLIAGTLVGLSRLGRGALTPPPLGSWTALRSWLDAREPVAAAFALLRVAAQVGCWYLLAVTTAGTVVRLVGWRPAVAAADLLTVPWVRRALAGVASTATLLAAPAGVAVATEPAPGSGGVIVRLSDEPVDGGDGVATMHQLPDEPTTTTTAPAPATVSAAPGAATRAWLVQPGEHFWHVAEETLAAAWGRTPTDREIVPYWRLVIEANRSKLADPGNPDLVFPGQQLTVPPPPASP
jgi:hypothetical protein